MSVYTVKPTDLQFTFKGTQYAITHYLQPFAGVHQLSLMRNDPSDGWLTHAIIFPMLDEQTILAAGGAAAFIIASIAAINAALKARVGDPDAGGTTPTTPPADIWAELDAAIPATLRVETTATGVRVVAK